jgi:hypothetical protein
VDIDDNGRSVGPELCCLECHQEARALFGMGRRPFRTVLVTGCDCEALIDVVI